jgi:hypothetical protein
MLASPAGYIMPCYFQGSLKGIDSLVLLFFAISAFKFFNEFLHFSRASFTCFVSHINNGHNKSPTNSPMENHMTAYVSVLISIISVISLLLKF